jgi:hypothetical protein
VTPEEISNSIVPGGGIEPPRPEGRRILSSIVGSEPLGKFSTLLYFSMGYQTGWLHRYDLIRRVLNMELLQFYYSIRRVFPDSQLGF